MILIVLQQPFHDFVSPPRIQRPVMIFSKDDRQSFPQHRRRPGLELGPQPRGVPDGGTRSHHLVALAMILPMGGRIIDRHPLGVPLSAGRPKATGGHAVVGLVPKPTGRPRRVADTVLEVEATQSAGAAAFSCCCWLLLHAHLLATNNNQSVTTKQRGGRWVFWLRMYNSKE